MKRRTPLFDVVCFGEILWDLFEVEVRRRERGRGGDRRRGGARRVDRPKAFRPELGGAPANVATGLARLGLRAAVVGGVGQDRFGEGLRQHLQADGVDVRFVVPFPNRTGLTFVARDARGEPEFLFYRHDSADLALRAADITPDMGRAHWVLVGTSTLVAPALAAATHRFLDVAEGAGARIFVDLNVRAHMWSSQAEMRRAIAHLASRASLIKASDADLAALSPRKERTAAHPSTNGSRHAIGARGSAQGSPSKGSARRPPNEAAWLAQHAPKATWLITRGAEFASAIGTHGEVTAPALAARCVDATGGGDAFIAGALASLLGANARPGSASWNDPAVWRLALQIGHKMGKKAVSRAGAVAGLVDLEGIKAKVDSMRRPRT